MRARKIIGRAGLGVLALVAAAVFALLIVGVPRPPAVTARHVPRLSWRSGVAVVGTVRESGALPRQPGLACRTRRALDLDRVPAADALPRATPRRRSRAPAIRDSGCGDAVGRQRRFCAPGGGVYAL